MASPLDKLKKNMATQAPPEAPKSAPEKGHEEEEKTYDYATPHSDGFTFHFEDGSMVKTHHGVMHLNQTQHNEIQRLIKKGRIDIAQQMVLTDKNAAEKAARAYLAELAAKRQAHQGASSTGQRQAAINEMAEQPRNLDVVEEDFSHGDDGQMKPPPETNS